jgi:crotonobetainyl-CoA:carnitine CoA-transferase CaiB-like acyl-CoA transferase
VSGPLEGLRVLDLGTRIAAPFCAGLLGEMGAEVIKVEQPDGGDFMRTIGPFVPPADDPDGRATYSLFWAVEGRGRKSVTIDLRQEAGQDLFRRLAATADVVVENFRPGVMDRLGLGAAAMTQAHPHLIYCSLPGFADDDPRAGVAAWEGVVSAAGGLYRRGRTSEVAGAPVYTAIPLASSYAAIQAAVAITMALGVRERYGAGQRIQVPLFDAMFGAVGYNGLRVHTAASPRSSNARTGAG